MTPTEYGIHLAVQAAPLSSAQVESAARVLADVQIEQVAA